VEALRRAAQRQAAPFSKGDRVPHPQAARAYAWRRLRTRAHRRPPEHVDQVVPVGLPACCPGCGGELALERVATQHVEELPPARPLVTRFQVQVGRCHACGRRVQPRHPGQTSDALGAAGTQLGPRDAGVLEAGELAAEVQALEAAVDRLVAGASRYPPNRRLLNHPARDRDHLFTFLRVPGVQATNWRAEQAIRPAVICRKAWGGNRTWAGAATWQALTSVLGTASQQGRDPSSCSLACYGHQRRSWPTSPSPGTDQHTRYLNTLRLPPPT
jgi:Transposase IS66 family/zinc-finger binding domain of transposase IS66